MALLKTISTWECDWCSRTVDVLHDCTNKGRPPWLDQNGSPVPPRFEEVFCSITCLQDSRKVKAMAKRNAEQFIDDGRRSARRVRENLVRVREKIENGQKEE